MTRAQLIGYAGAALVCLAAGLLIYQQLSREDSVMRTVWRKYVAALEHELRFLLVRTPGQRVARIQLGAILALPVLAFLIQDYVLLFLVPIVAILPYGILRRQHDKRVRRIEEQLDSWLLMLSNALKAVPSIGEAMGASARLMRPPISEELDLCLKELALGSPLDQAILNMARRIDSSVVAGALATVLIARQTGGDLPKLLENAASTLREMARLEGVVRTKTAEGRSQAWVLAVIPFALVGMLHKIDPHWLVPLTRTTLGYTLIGVSVGLWLLAIVAARKILAVDI